MMNITILHPFTPEAVGLSEGNFLTFHSQPHFRAAQMLARDQKANVTIDYFTSGKKGYEVQKEEILYRFFPVSRKWNGDHRKWKKQNSRACLRSYRRQTPDFTIINMSGHSSPFSFELSRVILNKNKHYIAMLGGQHYSDNERNRKYYRGAAHLQVHTLLQKKNMEKMDLFRGLDVRVFPLGVDTSVFEPMKKLNPVPSLLYVGRIIPWKRIHLAILGLKYLKDKVHSESHLRIIGPISSYDYLEELQGLIKELGLEENVMFLGPQPHKDLPKYYQEGDLLVLPSDKETFGMVMIEAMACGTPVAGMNCAGGPLEVINNGENGILSTPETFADDILNYFQSDQLAVKLSVNARKTVLTEYSIMSTYRAFKESIAIPNN